MIESRMLTKLRSAVGTLALLAMVYAVEWVFGDHGHTYFLSTPKESLFQILVEKLPLSGLAKMGSRDRFGIMGRGAIRSVIIRSDNARCCGSRLRRGFRVRTKTHFGGPYTDDDLFILKQIQQRR